MRELSILEDFYTDKIGLSGLNSTLYKLPLEVVNELDAYVLSLSNTGFLITFVTLLRLSSELNLELMLIFILLFTPVLP